MVSNKKDERKLKNRESAEKTRKEKDDKIRHLQDQVCKLSTNIYTIQVDNWLKKHQLEPNTYDDIDNFPKYISPILEHALFF